MKKIYLVVILLITFTIVGCSFNSATDKTEETKDGMTEEEFNNSGQAKAILDETDLWPIYDNFEVGFSFKYPANVNWLEKNKDETQLYVDVTLKDIGVTDIPMQLSAEDEMKTIEDLTAGEFGAVAGFSFAPSEKVKTVGFLFAQDYLVLARFEVCSVTLERKLTFYFKNKQITITLYGPVKTLKETMPEYFTVNADNCGEETIWDFDKQAELYNTLLAGEGSEEIQAWFDIFDDISETIIFAHR